MDFATLPPEIKLNICEQLDPTSCFNFARTSKEFRELFRPVLTRHARLFVEYESFSFDPKNGRRLWTKLEEVLGNPRIGWYARDLNLTAGYLDPPVFQHLGFAAGNNRPPQQLRDKFLAEAHRIIAMHDGASEAANRPWKKLLEDHIHDWAEETIVALLVYHLPYLKSLRFTTEGQSDLFYFLRQTAIAYLEPLKTPLLPLKHLTTVVIAHYDSERGFPPEWCLYACAIPSVRTFVASSMSGDLQDDLPSHMLKSNVKELLFFNSQVDVNALDVILSHIEALERFSYQGGGGIVCEDFFYEARKVIQTLGTRQGHALQHLTLEVAQREEDEDDLPRVSMRDFQKLKSLRCAWYMLWPDSDDEEDKDSDDDEALSEGFHAEESVSSEGDFDIHAILPQSLEQLHLDGDFSWDEWDKVTEAALRESALTPNLKSVLIDRGGGNVEKTEGATRIPAVNEHPGMSLLEGHGYV